MEFLKKKPLLQEREKHIRMQRENKPYLQNFNSSMTCSTYSG